VDHRRGVKCGTIAANPTRHHHPDQAQATPKAISPVVIPWLKLTLCAIVAIAGPVLTRYGEVIARCLNTGFVV
jgi:hypothetical protein